MLLQPLVEHAVRHGIEPKLAGGEIVILAELGADRLRVEVRDDGMGLDHSGQGSGTGLSNVRARLAALFGDTGRLSIGGNGSGGVAATLEIPR